MNNDERDLLIEKAIDAKYQFYTDKVIDMIKAMPGDCLQSGDDSPLDSVWKEWAYQLQFERFVLYFAFEETFRGFCQSVISDMPEHEIKLLWAGRDILYTDIDFEDGPVFLSHDRLVKDLEDELFRRVNDAAENEELDIIS